MGNPLSPLRREGVLIAVGKRPWKIVDAGNAINAADLHYWVALDSPTRLTLATWDAALELGELLAQTARWPGYSLIYTPVVHVEMQGGVPTVWWDALEKSQDGQRFPVVHEPS